MGQMITDYHEGSNAAEPTTSASAAVKEMDDDIGVAVEFEEDESHKDDGKPEANGTDVMQIPGLRFSGTASLHAKGGSPELHPASEHRAPVRRLPRIRLPHLRTKTALLFEECLSVDGFRIVVKRHLEVEATGLSHYGKPIKVAAAGWSERASLLPEPKAMETITRFSGRLFPISAAGKCLRIPPNRRFPPSYLLGPNGSHCPVIKSATPELNRAFHGSFDRSRRHPPSTAASAGWFLGLGKKKGAVLPRIVKARDPVLHEPTGEVAVEEIGSKMIQKTIEDRVAVMRKAPGVGLAAPQIEIPSRIIALEDTKEYVSYTQAAEVASKQRLERDRHTEKHPIGFGDLQLHCLLLIPLSAFLSDRILPIPRTKVSANTGSVTSTAKSTDPLEGSH